MTYFPDVDNSCPLSVDEKRRVNGYCGRCRTPIHALDDMSEDERRQLLRDATGPLCVSYHLPPRPSRAARFNAAIAATLIATTTACTGGSPSADAKAPTDDPAAEEVVFVGLIKPPPEPPVVGKPVFRQPDTGPADATTQESAPPRNGDGAAAGLPVGD